MSWPESPCNHCPRLAKGRTGRCLSQIMRSRHVCDRTDPDHPAFDPRWVARVCGEEAPEVEEQSAATGTSTSESTPLNPHVERLLLVMDCDYRTDALDECGCTARRHCGLARGQFLTEPHAVSMSDCLNCVAET